MKNSLNIPSIDANSLGNSLFECITIDADNINKPKNGKEQPMLVQAGIICICLRGEASFVINSTTYSFRKGDMLTLLPNTILLGGTSSDDFMGYALVANTKFMMGIQMTDVVKSYVNISNNPVISLNGEQIQTVIELCEMLKQKRAKKEHPLQSRNKPQPTGRVVLRDTQFLPTSSARQHHPQLSPRCSLSGVFDASGEARHGA